MMAYWPQKWWLSISLHHPNRLHFFSSSILSEQVPTSIQTVSPNFNFPPTWASFHRTLGQNAFWRGWASITFSSEVWCIFLRTHSLVFWLLLGLVTGCGELSRPGLWGAGGYKRVTEQQEAGHTYMCRGKSDRLGFSYTGWWAVPSSLYCVRYFRDG